MKNRIGMQHNGIRALVGCVKYNYLNMPLASKMLIVYFSMFVLFFAISTLLVVYLSYNSIRQQNFTLVEQTVNNKCMDINRSTERYEILLDGIIYNDSLKLFLGNRVYIEQPEYIYVDENLLPKMDAILNAEKDNVYIQIVRKNEGTEIIHTNFEGLLSSSNKSDKMTKSFDIVNGARAEWLKNDSLMVGTGHLWVNAGADYENQDISLISTITGRKLWEENLGVARLVIKADTLIPEIDNDELNSLNFIMVDEDMKYCYGNSTGEMLFEEFGSDIKNASDKGIKKLTVGRELFIFNKLDNGFTLIGYLPMNALYDKTFHVVLVILISGIGMMIIMYVVVKYTSKRFSSRITTVSMVMKSFEQGDFNVRVDDDSNDEVGYLGSAFNSMKDRIDGLIKRIYQVEKEKNEASLRLLQAQLNPHFLYNTLSNISGLADMGECDDIKHVCLALSTYYRTALSGGRDVITIEEEIQNINSYLNIMRQCNKKSFNISIDVQPDVLHLFTIKSMLQPFVENIFEHAVKRGLEQLHIEIKIFIQEETLKFEISDNGCGIDSETLNQINKGMKPSHGGYGIDNVRQRINAWYGHNGIIEIESEMNKGTIVTISVPVERMLSNFKVQNK